MLQIDGVARIPSELFGFHAYFDYAAGLTEVVLLGALAQRSGKTIEWDAENMKVKGQPEFDKWIKEPVREGWAFGEDLWA